MWSFRGNWCVIQIRKGDSYSSPMLIRDTPDIDAINATASVILPLNKGETYYIEFLNTIIEVFSNTFYPLKGKSIIKY